MNNNLLSIVTIGFNNFNEVIETINSIDSQELKPFENILVLSNFSDKEKETLTNNYSLNYRKFYWDIDTSLFNAMNIGIRKSNGNSIFF